MDRDEEVAQDAFVQLFRDWRKVSSFTEDSTIADHPIFDTDAVGLDAVPNLHVRTWPPL